jgi:hypothetical protein
VSMFGQLSVLPCGGAVRVMGRAVTTGQDTS